MRRGTSSAGSGAYALQLADGSRVVADAVVLATPAWASGDLLRAVAPLPAADLSSIDYVSTATASLAFRATRWGTTSTASASSCRAPRTVR